MKTIFFAGFLALSIGTSISLANDGGVMGIKVKSTSMVKHTFNAEKGEMKTEAVEHPDYTIQLTGGDAKKLMRVLPPSQSVLTYMHPKFAKTFNANFRTLDIVSGALDPVITIGCEGGDLEFPEDKAPIFKPFADGAHCTIRVRPDGEGIEDDNIDFSYDPVKNSCKS